MQLIESKFPAVAIATLVLLVSVTATAGDKLKAGDPAPSLMARNINGQMVYLTDHCGDRRPLGEKTKVVVHFFSTTCKPCIKEIPALKKLRKAYSPKALTILMVSVADKRSKVVDYKEKWKLEGMDFLLDKYGYNAQKWKISNKKENSINFSLPYTFLVNETGYIKGVYPGTHTDLDKLISEKIK